MGVIEHPELPPDHLGDAIQRPQFVGIAVGDGPFQQQVLLRKSCYISEGIVISSDCVLEAYGF
jgi:hypothetical protein